MQKESSLRKPHAHSLLLKRKFLLLREVNYELRPCTYLGTYGVWDEEGQKSDPTWRGLAWLGVAWLSHRLRFFFSCGYKGAGTSHISLFSLFRAFFLFGYLTLGLSFSLWKGRY